MRWSTGAAPDLIRILYPLPPEAHQDAPRSSRLQSDCPRSRHDAPQAGHQLGNVLVRQSGDCVLDLFDTHRVVRPKSPKCFRRNKAPMPTGVNVRGRALSDLQRCHFRDDHSSWLRPRLTQHLSECLCAYPLWVGISLSLWLRPLSVTQASRL